ncbi:MAG TPA: ABC transporter substrate-binding protein [Anaerolineaceae bacterium]|jgi:iron complex transport system substrate-binding protein|nr:ABC transporter substrate-binding protein [Anaerolineaceae bacterium]
MKKIATLCLFVLVLTLTGCTSTVPAPDGAVGPLTIMDAQGRTVELPAVPLRIVIAGRASALLADAVYLFPEARERVVAYSTTSQGTGDFIAALDPDYADKAAFGTDVGPEQVAAFTPDLVIMKSYMAEKLGTPLEALGIPVIYLDLETPDQYTRDLNILGQIFQNEARAAELSAYYGSVVLRVKAGLAESQPRPQVLLLYYNNRDGEVAFNVPPVGWLQTTLVQLAGGDPVWQDIELGTGWTKVNLEQIAAWNPDQIYVVAYTVNAADIVPELEQDPAWQALQAVQNGQLHAFPVDYLSWDQPDPRWALGLLWLADTIQPGVLPVDMPAETRIFYEKLYLLDDAAYAELISPVLPTNLEP